MLTSRIYATQAYNYLADELAAAAGLQRGRIERNTFPDGEHYHRLLDLPAGEEAILVGGTIGEEQTLELYDLACALVQAGALRLQLVVPYFGYSTMERAVKAGEVVKARTRAMLLSAIPPAARNNRILLLDLHSEGIPYYFDPRVQAAHVYAKPVILEAARAAGGTDFVLAATDSGRAKWVESLANDLHVPAAFVYKRRTSGSETVLTGVNADVKGKRVVIYDDMVRTGGSLVQAAQAYHDAGAQEVYALATHLIMPDGALERIKQSGLFKRLIGTNSHPRALALAEDPFVKVYSVAQVFIEPLGGPLAW